MNKEDFIKNRNASVVFDKEYKFLFFNHNKNAQTSVNRNLLMQRAIVKKDNVDDWKKYRKFYEEHFDTLNPITFTIIRNPLDRFCSAFFYLQERKKIPKSFSIDYFTQKVFLKEGILYDPHFIPQEKYTKPIYELGFDYILKIETLETDWKKMCSAISVDPYIPKVNTSKNLNFDTNNLSKQSLEIIYNTYRDDFKNLGYNFNE